MFGYSFILLYFLLPIFPIHSFFTNPISFKPIIGIYPFYNKNNKNKDKKELTYNMMHCSKTSCDCNCYSANHTFKKIHNITELQIHLNTTLALPVRWNDGEVPW